MLQTFLFAWLALAAQKPAEPPPVYPDMPKGRPPVLEVPDASAANEGEMKRYAERVPGTSATFDLVPIRGGKFTMGTGESEAGRKPAEGPTHEVEIAPFWMGRTEVTWDEYLPFQMKLDKAERAKGAAQGAPQDPWADAVSRPTPPYVPMDFGMGTAGFPAISMTQFAARQYTQWLSMKTGRFYRLPTEAEWEYACRAGTGGAYSFGDDPAALGEYAWFLDNAGETYHKVGTKKPNPWGLYDTCGNVNEWCRDWARAELPGGVDPDLHDVLGDPNGTGSYSRARRGGCYDDPGWACRSAFRQRFEPERRHEHIGLRIAVVRP